MHIALVLHLYQPPTQYPAMVRKIATQSYEKIVNLLLENPKAKLTLNINASLAEQLRRLGYEELLQGFSDLARKGQIELTGSAAYHPILPDIPSKEIVRQIRINSAINQSIFGSAYKPVGFFPPELAYTEKVGDAVKKSGFKWVIVDSSAVSDWRKYLTFIYRRDKDRLIVFPREDNISFRISYGKIRTVLGLLRSVSSREIKKRQYLVLAMDGETFGHHQPKQLRFLKELFRASHDDPRINLVTVTKLLELYPKRQEVQLLSSTWGYTEEIEGKKIWVRWGNPRNPLHNILNNLRSLALSCVRTSDSLSRELLDRALNSDTFWWASGKPFWHPDMVRRGAKLYYQAVMMSAGATGKQKRRARYLYTQVLETEILRLRNRSRRILILDGGVK